MGKFLSDKEIREYQNTIYTLRAEIEALQSKSAALVDALEDIKAVPRNKFVWKGTSEENIGARRAIEEIMPIVDAALAAFKGEK